MLAFRVADMVQMKLEFPQIFNEMFMGIREKLNKLIALQLAAV